MARPSCQFPERLAGATLCIVPLKSVLTFLTLISLAFLQRGLERFVALRETAWVPSAESAREQWNPRIIRFMSFGHPIAAADAYWIRFAQNTSLTRVPRGRLSTAYVDLDMTTSLDPKFFDAYISGASLLAVVRDDIDGSLRLLLKGEKFADESLASFPQSFQEKFWKDRWMIQIVLGYLYLFEKEDLTSSADAFIRASELPGSPPYVGQLARRLREPGGLYEVGIRVLRFLASQAKDPTVRAKYESRIHSLEVGKYLQELNRVYVESKASSSQEFLKGFGLSATDPWGGRLFEDGSGVIRSTTPRERVLGLD